MKLATEIEEVPIQKLIGKYALPAILSGVIAALYNIIDQIFIGNIIGTEGNAATNIAFPLVTLTTAIMLLFGLGGTINFSIALGQKNVEQAKKFVGVILILTPITGILVSVMTLLNLDPLLKILGSTEHNHDLAMTYVSITAFGFPLWMTTEASTKVIRADGSPKYAMICSITGAILNCFLNPLFMSVFDMGIAGAAYATITGQLVSFILTIKYFFKFNTFDIKFSEIKPDLHTVKRTCILGMSPFFNQMVMMVAQIVMNNTYVFYGAQSIYGSEIPLACVGIITKINAIYMSIMVGIAQGAQPLFGYCYGSNKPEKVLDIYFICIKYATIISVGVFIILQTFPRQILSIFGGDGELFFEFGVSYFKIFMFMTFLNGIQPISFNFFSAIGKPIKSTIISLSKQLIFLIPLVIIIPRFYGLEGILYAGPIADTAAFCLTSFFLTGEIKNLKLKCAENNKKLEDNKGVGVI